MTPAPPSITECLLLMEDHAMLPNIREHSFVVARVAEKILTELSSHSSSNALPDKNLITAGALLHDIAKTQCLQEGCDHAEVGSALCRQNGYPQIAEIVAEHVRLHNFSPERYQKGVFEAKELIFYADKRVVHDQVVSLEERLEYILARYGRNDRIRCELIRTNFNKCRTLEKYICHSADCSAQELLRNLSTRPYAAEKS